MLESLVMDGWDAVTYLQQGLGVRLCERLNLVMFQVSFRHVLIGASEIHVKIFVGASRFSIPIRRY